MLNQLTRGQKLKRLTRGQKAWLAIERFAPMREGEAARTYPDLRSAFKNEYGDSVGIRTMQNAIREAFEDELVTIRRTFTVPDYKRNTALEKALETTFKNLKYAIVPEIRQKDSDRVDSDTVYSILGQALADHIQNSRNLFRPNDAIGLGSGRSVYWTVSALREFEGVPVSPVILASLTGSMFTKNQTSPASELLDGDTHVTMLLQHFGQYLQISMIRHSIAQNSESARNTALKTTWLGDFDSHVPAHAIVGCGVLDLPGHRFNQEWAERRLSETLKPIAGILERIMKRMEEIKDSYPTYRTIIADVCNRFFVVPPPRPLLQEAGLTKKLSDMKNDIDELNKRLITVTKHQLSRVNNVMLIGGPGKENALHYLLNLKFKDGGVSSNSKGDFVHQPEGFKVDTLCVDADTAEKLIAIANSV